MKLSEPQSIYTINPQVTSSQTRLHKTKIIIKKNLQIREKNDTLPRREKPLKQQHRRKHEQNRKRHNIF